MDRYYGSILWFVSSYIDWFESSVSANYNHIISPVLQSKDITRMHSFHLMGNFYVSAAIKMVHEALCLWVVNSLVSPSVHSCIPKFVMSYKTVGRISPDLQL